MALTRLRLDFSLQTNSERAAFLDKYLQSETFQKSPPTDEELEMMGNYVLWGKDPKTGLNAQQEGLLTIETKHKTWDKDSNVESLEGLLEQPTFNEATLRPLSSNPIKQKREVFDRTAALNECPEYLRPTFEQLFAEIDELDLCINFWDLEHGKRKNPPRPELIAKFSEEQIEEMRERITHWNQFRYLKMRHQLVELRREAYTLRDSYKQTILGSESVGFCDAFPDPDFDVEIEVLPLGAWNDTHTRGLVFRDWDMLVPKNFGEEDLRLVSDLIWQKKSYKPGPQQRWIDFRELEHVYEMFQLFFELKNAAAGADLESNLPALMKTLNFYVERAELSEVQRDILDLKLKKVRNEDIATQINQKWGKTYTANYISTIFRQKIIPRINDAAKYHEKVVGHLFFEEDFKTCTKCGRVLLKDAINFTRRGRSPDGFTSHCKKCEKEARQHN